MDLTFDYYHIRPCVYEANGETIVQLEIPWTEDTETSGWCGHGVADAKQAAEDYDGPVIWTLYGHGSDGEDRAIGDFTTFEAAYEILSAMLLPIRWAMDKHGDNPDLEDILNQSTNEDRL